MYSNNIEIGANMFNLVWKEQSTKRWIITEELTDHMVSLVCIGLIGLTTGII